MCNICKINNHNLLKEIEQGLIVNHGTLSYETKAQLKTKFPDFTSSIDNITNQDCNIHWNFHQSIKRIPAQESGSSLNSDINKDEAQVLTDLLNTQYATFVCLTNKINETLNDSEIDLKNLVINPINVQLYKETADSIRSTVKEIRELNKDINGAKDGSLEGLKAIAVALSGGKSDTSMNTDLYD